MTDTSEVTMEKQRDKHNHLALRPEPLPLWTKMADVAMRPLMFVLGGFRRDSMQETHPWHCQRDIDPSLIDPALTVTTNGETDELLPGRFSFLFFFMRQGSLAGGIIACCGLSRRFTLAG